ncbi:MAG TPA: tetratricopeptide repeat protein [Rhodanobacteraceae bacterium]|nr:tetratricopeptide repeat protein [Rhodanobacteraceae bacterium]
MKLPRSPIPCALVLALAACGQAAPPVKPAPPPQAGGMVHGIREAGRSMASAVEVQPLRDPAVEGFLRQAEALEAQNRYAEAMQQVDRALRLAPDAPELLQYRAELAIAQGRYAEAEGLARKSYDLGPRVGSLCARNWQTVVELREAAGDAAGADSARAQLASCAVKAPVRM